MPGASQSGPAGEFKGQSYGAEPSAAPIWSGASSNFGEEPMKIAEAAGEFFTQYARQRPEVVALWAFGIGFVLGWRLKPW